MCVCERERERVCVFASARARVCVIPVVEFFLFVRLYPDFLFLSLFQVADILISCSCLCFTLLIFRFSIPVTVSGC